jgi:tetratricopeptide (TPR) repeat protein
MKALRNLAISLTLEHIFPLDGKKQQLSNILNLVLPELIKNENESSWLNRIRVSLMTKRDKLKDFTDNQLTHLVGSLQNVGLKPSFKTPWELRYGIPKIRTSETLLFSNDDKFDEFFVLEKGYFTYFKDLEYSKFHLRGLFDSYSPYILNDLFSDNPDFKLEIFVENWVKFTRMILNSLVEIIKRSNFNQTEFVNFRPIKEFLHKSPKFVENVNNFPLSALSYESSITKELFTIHNDLFNKPPSNFEVIESINQYTEAEQLIKNYRFEEAAHTLNQALKVFNKNQQRKIVVNILLKLRKIAKILNQEEAALNYLQNALGVAKSGEIPIEFIIIVHYRLGVTYYKRKNYPEALNHFQIILNFLENENISFNKEKFLGFSYLYVGMIYLERDKTNEAKNNFKNSLQIGNKFLKIKLKYFLLRAKYYKNQGKLSFTQKFLKAGLDAIDPNFENEENLKVIADLVLESAEFCIHYRKDAKKAFYLLKSLESSLTIKEISNMKRAVRWNLLMSDYYNVFGVDREKSHFYLRQSQKLKKQLQTIGIDA